MPDAEELESCLEHYWELTAAKDAELAGKEGDCHGNQRERTEATANPEEKAEPEGDAEKSVLQA